MLRTKMMVLAITAVLPIASSADDGSWTLTGQGSTVMPLQSTQVTMAAETVTIRPSDSLPDRWDSKARPELKGYYRWYADCTFQFKNGSDTPADVLMGFPDTWVDDSWRWEFYEDQEPPKLNAIREFQSWVDGQEVAVEPRDPDVGMKKDWPKISRVLTWTVHFEPGQTREVRNRYRFGGAVDTVNTGDGFYQIEYVLRTGALWKGPIGSAEIRIYPGKDWHPGPGIECWNGNWVHLTWQHAVLAPCGYRWEKTPEPCFVWILKDFVPKEDIQVFLVTGAIEPLSSPDEGDLPDLRNRKYTLLAARGMVFESPSLRSRFGGMRAGSKALAVTCLRVPDGEPALLYPSDDSRLTVEYAYTAKHWYTPDPKFKETDLTPCERDYVRAVDKRIAFLESKERTTKKYRLQYPRSLPFLSLLFFPNSEIRIPKSPLTPSSPDV